MIKCPKCGDELPKESRFCPYCMHRLTSDSKYTQNSKTGIKWYILLSSSIFMCVVIVFLIIYGSIINKNNSHEDEKDIYYSENEQLTTENKQTIHNVITTTSNEEVTVETLTYETTLQEDTMPQETSTPPESTTGQVSVPTRPITIPTAQTPNVNPTEPPTAGQTQSSTMPPVETETTTFDVTESEVIETTQSTVEVCVHEFKEPTCTEYGYCIKCGVKGERPLMHDDNYYELSCEDKVCSLCGRISYGIHDYSNLSCMAKGPCIRCGKIGIKYHRTDSETGKCSICDSVYIEYAHEIQIGEVFSMNLGVTDINRGKWKNVTVGSDYKFEVVTDRSSDFYGETVVGIPITHDRLSKTDTGISHYAGYIEGYDNDDAISPAILNIYIDDGFEFYADENEKSQVTEYYYIRYDGDGYYKLVFYDIRDIVTPTAYVVRIKIQK